ncbi:ubiquitin conjugating enzyme (UbcC), putative [Talaromyces stipitatus ATCC 10500]|uniref:Ubiquitin-conjugating enzyme E2 2 n=1 Tax=Talaromyces stipitatus (strain ATCC 10500 / CBS 375.48 / QM 6759 / NRRL 1006) TaxID=441959 RepID=B8MD47_TALSN|nr:ubiquitin conjugating enzyme (UbcC), putative [Talaromyces stipitatus ATCC 10500]EED17572.1 ubiquitin conjugating enzyme (UbcC), putative [Talaromyces stipitatus ATCC 10500]
MSRPLNLQFRHSAITRHLACCHLQHHTPLHFCVASDIMAERILMNEFKALSKEKWVNIELKSEDIFCWKVALIVLNPDSLYYGGYFKAVMEFPKNYPYSPPKFRFHRPIWHPNIYTDGKLCISILHTPGEDEQSGELAAERWSPAQRVESVLISILSLLDDAECSSPANVDAGVQLRKDPKGYREHVRQDVESSKQDIPDGFVMPTFESTLSKPTEKDDADKEDLDFWADSDVDDDPFGGSDSSDVDMDEDDDDEMGSLDEDDDEEDNETDGDTS